MPRADERLWSFMAHLGILFSWLGLLGAFAIYLIYRRRSAFVEAHARQAFGFQAAVLAVFYVLSLALAGTVLFAGSAAGRLMGSLTFGGLLMLGALLYALVAALQAVAGRSFRYALIGELFDRL